MRIRVFDTPHDAGIYTAAQVEQVILEMDDPVLGLATGSTPIPLYQSLVTLYQSGLDFSRAVTINLDEYIGIPSSHKESYRFFMQQQLFERTNIAPRNINFPDGMAADLGAECARYDEVLKQYPIDLQILGVGVNGHIGFNEPDDLLKSKTHVVNLRPETVKSNARFFDRMEDVPKQAITMGVQAILQARKIILMAFGMEKAEIVAKAIRGEVRTDVPASILLLHPDVTVVLDVESASRLSEG